MQANELNSDQTNRVRDSMDQWYFGELSHATFTAIQNKIQEEVRSGDESRPARPADRTAAAGERGK